MLTKIISGGQTGVDIAALRAAKAVGLETGGWMPKAFLTAAGKRPEWGAEFGMQEAATDDYRERTRLNVRDSNRTLIVGTDVASRGSLATITACNDEGRFYATAKLQPDGTATEALTESVIGWIANEASVVAGYGHGMTLNIAGNRDAWLEAPVEAFLRLVFAEVARRQNEGR